jgi:hypothetical protein
MIAKLTPHLAWILLVAAGLLEIVWSVSMKASHGFTKPLFTFVTLAGAALSFWLLGLALRELPVGTESWGSNFSAATVRPEPPEGNF